MLRIPSGVPGVSATGFASSPVTVAETAAFAVAGAHSAVAATSAAKSFLPEYILPPEKGPSLPVHPYPIDASGFKTQPPRWDPGPMPVLVDPLRHYDHLRLAIKDWCHMAVDGEFEELHAFAAALGIPRHRFQGDHYDLPPWLRERAVGLGAQEVSTGELLQRMAGPRGDRARRRIARRG